MRWKMGRRSENVEDRRGAGMPRGVAVGGMSGCGLLILLLIALFFGVNPLQLIQNMPQSTTEPTQAPRDAAQDEKAEFVSVVLADIEDTWTNILRQKGVSYAPPKLVLYSGMTESACGLGQAAMGPFYCPGDQKVYIDLVFFNDLENRLHAPGDFAQAYVIAHEVGHHVQNLLGISAQVDEMQRRVDERSANALSVCLELQADCYAGVWAHHAQRMRSILEPGDIEEALGAASAVGDDRLQKQAQGYAVPDSFTHGTAAQRAFWFRRGFETGDCDECDTFRQRSQ